MSGRMFDEALGVLRVFSNDPSFAAEFVDTLDEVERIRLIGRLVGVLAFAVGDVEPMLERLWAEKYSEETRPGWSHALLIVRAYQDSPSVAVDVAAALSPVDLARVIGRLAQLTLMGTDDVEALADRLTALSSRVDAAR